MANSSLFLGIKNMVAAKLGTRDVKLALGTKLLYPLSKPINDAVVTCDSATYNGSNQVAQNIVVTLSGVTLVSGTDYTVTSNTGGTNVGSYSVTVSGTGNYEGNTSGTFTINKVTPTVTAPTPKSNLVYDGNNKALVNEGSTNFGTLKYSLDGTTYSTAIPSGTNASSYTVYYKVDGDSNVNDVPAQSINAIIEKANGSVTTVPTAKSITYSGSAQALVNAGSGTGTMMYKLGSGDWGTSIPTATNATSYTVYYKASASTNYNESASGSVSVTISKVTPTVTAPKACSLTYNGSAQNLVSGGSTNYGSLQYSTTSGGTYSATIPQGTNATSYDVWYKVVGNDNVNSTTPTKVSVTINKADQSAPTATGATTTYNTTATATASGGGGYGSIEWSNGDTQTSVGSKTTKARWSGNGNYCASSWSNEVILTMNKADISPTVSISNWTYGGTASNPSVAGNTGGGTVTYYYKLSSTSSWSTTKPSGAGDYDIRADIAATTNYNSGTCSSTFAIIKGESSLSFAVTGLGVEIGETKTNAVTVNAGDGTVTYSSNNTAAVTVNNSGVVTGVSVGSATITANISQTSNYNAASATYAVSCGKSIIGKFNITDITYESTIGTSSQFIAMEIDGVALPSPVTTYQFSRTGEHTIKYILANPTSIGTDAFSNCNSLTSVTIPNTVTSIGESAFSHCTSLTSVTIPNSVTSIGANTFRNCTGLTSVTIPNTVTSIGTDAFSNCTSLTSVTIGSGVTSIGNSAFRNCTSLTSVTIPNSVTSIGSYAFRNCTSLTTCTIGNGITTISNGAFQGCGFTSVTIGSGVTKIDTQAFRDCSNLTGITIPNNVTNISSSAFTDCSDMTIFIIGDGLKQLMSYIFKGCKKLANITCNKSKAPTVTSNTFYGIATNGTLYIPTGSSSSYSTWMGTGSYYLGKYNWTKIEQ